MTTVGETSGKGTDEQLVVERPCAPGGSHLIRRAAYHVDAVSLNGCVSSGTRRHCVPLVNSCTVPGGVVTPPPPSSVRQQEKKGVVTLYATPARRHSRQTSVDVEVTSSSPTSPLPLLPAASGRHRVAVSDVIRISPRPRRRRRRYRDAVSLSPTTSSRRRRPIVAAVHIVATPPPANTRVVGHPDQ